MVVGQVNVGGADDVHDASLGLRTLSTILGAGGKILKYSGYVKASLAAICGQGLSELLPRSSEQ